MSLCFCGHTQKKHFSSDGLDNSCHVDKCGCSNHVTPTEKQKARIAQLEKKERVKEANVGESAKQEPNAETQQNKDSTKSSTISTAAGTQRQPRRRPSLQAAVELEDEEMTVSQASELMINDEYASLVPPISELEYQSIKQSIKDESLLVPIIVNAQRIILDGHTRFRACKELQMVPRIMIRQFEGPLQEKQFIIQINRKRRHLNQFQRVELESKFQTKSSRSKATR